MTEQGSSELIFRELSTEELREGRKKIGLREWDELG